MIAQRNALLAWTGHTLTVKPQLNTKMVRRPRLPRFQITDVKRAWLIGEILASLVVV